MTKCKCNDFKKLAGREGQEYVESHLIEVAQNPDSWEVLYICPYTKIYWKLYYPLAEAHGGGQPEFISMALNQAIKEFDIRGNENI